MTYEKLFALNEWTDWGGNAWIHEQCCHSVSVSGELIHYYFNYKCITVFPIINKKSVGTQIMIRKEIPFWIEWGMDGLFLGYLLFGFFNAGEL